MQRHKTRVFRKLRRVGTAQLHLHVGVDHAGRQRDHLRTILLARLFQRNRTRQMVHAGLHRTVRGSAGHGPPAQARTDEQQPPFDLPRRGGAQEGRAQQKRGFQPDAQALHQFVRLSGGQRRRCRDRRGVVDQGDRHRRFGGLFSQPDFQPGRHGPGVGQVHGPLLQVSALNYPQVGGVPRNRQQPVSAFEQLLGHGGTQTTGRAGEDREMHVHRKS